jgi:hypothetical protein
MIIRRWGGSQTTARVGSTTNTNVLVQAISTDGLVVGTAVSGTGIPAGATIASIVGPTSFNLSAAATATGTPTLTFSGLFFTEYPRTKAQLIRTNADDNNIFDGNDKIKLAYLPNAVFDSLHFYDVIGGNTTLAALAEDVFESFNSTSARSRIGIYFVANAARTITPSLSAVLIDGEYWIGSFKPSEESEDEAETPIVLETGDWIILTAISGAGTVGSPWNTQWAVVNNTYEFMTGADGTNPGAPGIVPAPAATDNVKYLTGAGTWGTPAGTYAHPTQTAITANATDDGINVIDSVTVNTLGHVTAVGTRNLSAATASVPGHMTAAYASKLDGIATGATANSSDATLLSRANHTGSQTAATISDFATAVAATASVTANTAKVTNATHDGDVTGATTLTIAANIVSNAKFRQSAGLSIVGRTANTTGDVADITAATDGDVLRRSGTTVGFGTIASAGIADNAVTYAKLQNISATNRILGRITAAAGNAEELTAANVRTIIELAAPIYIQTATPTATVTNALWYDIN